MDNQNKIYAEKREGYEMQENYCGRSFDSYTNLIFVHDTFGHCDDRKCRFICHQVGIPFSVEFAAHISLVLMNYASYHFI